MIQFQPNQSLKNSDRLKLMDEVDTPRLLIWGVAWKQFIQEPFGAGISTFGFTSVKFFSSELVNLTKEIELFWDEAHNEFFQILANQGIFGAIIFLAIIGVLITQWIRWRKDKSRDLALAGIWTAIFVHLFVIMFSFSGIGYTFILWLYIGFISVHAPGNLHLTHFKPSRLVKILASTALLIFITGFSFLFLKADSAFFDWHNPKLSHTQRILYINRAIYYAPWEEEYRYSRVITTQQYLAENNINIDKVKRWIPQLINDNKMLLNENPLEPRNYELTAETLIILRNYKSALEAYQSALVLYPMNYKYLSRIGDVLMGLGRNTEACKYYEKALKIRDDYIYALKGLENLRKQ
jgi:hypothetical protein